MRHAGLMKYRLTPYVLTTAKNATGGVDDTWTVGTTVWGSLTSPREGRNVGAGRYEYPVTKVARVDHVAWAVAGNRIVCGSTTYDILGADPEGEVTRLDLREVTR